jgi:hypothetical protein
MSGEREASEAGKRHDGWRRRTNEIPLLVIREWDRVGEGRHGYVGDHRVGVFRNATAFDQTVEIPSC